MAEKVDQDDIAFVRSLIDCTDKPTHESMFIPFFAAKIGAYRAEAFAAGRQQGLREAAEVALGCEPARYDDCDLFKHSIAAAITALIEGEGNA